MRILVSFCLVLLSVYALAEPTLPTGCQPVAVRGEAVTLKSKKAKLVFIHNISKTDMWLTHPVIDSGASAGWTSRLQSGNWSALVVDKPPFALTCIESRPGHEQQLPCEGAIAVCQWLSVKIPNNLQNGTFWAAEDKSLDALTAAIGGRGLILPVAK
jgi:hypothetical protein